MKKLILLFLSFVCTFSGVMAQEDITSQMARMRELVYTEDSQLNAISEKIFSQCIFSKLFDPIPPALPNRWFSPGGGYVGQWIWDTQFVLAAYAPMGDDAIIRGVFDNYWQTIDKNPEAPVGSYRFGMVPCFMSPKHWPPLGFSQIPILAWGMLQVYHQTGDRQLLEQSLPYLLAFHDWYSSERDVDNDGLIEYGAYKPVGKFGMLQTARFETFDYFPPMDSMKLTKHPARADGGEWYGNVEGVEQTCFLLMSEQALMEIALELGESEIAERFDKIIHRRILAIQKKMWNQKKKFFFSLDRDSDRQINVRSIQGFLTLAAGAATKKQAEELVAELMDTTIWWCKYPVPTVALNDPKFEMEGFWRGDMWPVTTYLVAYGLNRYGYHDEARLLTDKMVELVIRYGVNERYNGVTGKPLGVKGLGMSSSVWSMIVENYYGVTNDYKTIRIPKNAKGRHLKLGQLEVSYPSNNEVVLWSGFERNLKVVFPEAFPKASFIVSCEGNKYSDGVLKTTSRSIGLKVKANKYYRIHIDKKNETPNIVIIFTDDQGYQDVGCFGSPLIKTPNLDHMAKNGMKFTDFYSASPVCSPSRAALLTGCYPPRVGVPQVLWPDDENGLDPREITIADLLKGKGYTTACIGKWHLGDRPDFLPKNQGFDSYMGIPYSNDMTINPRVKIADNAVFGEGFSEATIRKGERKKGMVPLMIDNEVVEYPVDQALLTKRYTEEAVKIITENKDNPFFIYLAHTMPHIPLFASEEFRGISERGLYGDVIEEIDWSVGEILKTLKSLNIDENTLVIFTSDNGPWNLKNGEGGSALPLRGFKFQTYEGGMRVPMITYWPGKVPGGTVCSEVASTIDMFPTIAYLTGSDIPSDRIIDGENIWPLMSGKKGVKSPHSEYYYYSGNTLQAVRSGEWKLRRVKGNVELFNLKNDVSESRNVASVNPGIVKRLTQAMEKFDGELKSHKRKF